MQRRDRHRDRRAPRWTGRMIWRQARLVETTDGQERVARQRYPTTMLAASSIQPTALGRRSDPESESEEPESALEKAAR